jgi:putative aminopeptidase FrvX
MAAVLLLEALRQMAREPLAGVAPVFVFAAQSEVGGRGLLAAATRLEPAYALALEPTAVHPEREQDLGAGAVVLHRLNGMQTDARLRGALLDLATTAATPHWVEIGARQYGGRSLGSRGLGVQTVGLGIPVRYRHTPFEMIDWGDVAHVQGLLEAFLRQPGWWTEGSA